MRLLLKPVVRVPLGPVLLRNVTRIAWLSFSGTGPYFLEWEYDTLFKDGDWYLADMLQALVTVGTAARRLSCSSARSTKSPAPAPPGSCSSGPA